MPKEYVGGDYAAGGGRFIRGALVDMPSVFLEPTRANTTVYDPEQVLVPDPISDACGRLVSYCLEGALVWGYPQPEPQRIADLGTGSGIFLVSVLDGLKVPSRQPLQVHALDIDQTALLSAKTNINRSRSATPRPVEVRYSLADYGTGLEGKYDYIFFNPPYLERGHDITHMEAALAPDIALYSDTSTSEYERILPMLPKFLSDTSTAFVRLPKEDPVIDKLVAQLIESDDSFTLLHVSAGAEIRKGRFLMISADTYPDALGDYDYFYNYLGGKERRARAKSDYKPFYSDPDCEFVCVRREEALRILQD